MATCSAHRHFIPCPPPGPPLPQTVRARVACCDLRRIYGPTRKGHGQQICGAGLPSFGERVGCEGRHLVCRCHMDAQVDVAKGPRPQFFRELVLLVARELPSHAPPRKRRHVGLASEQGPRTTPQYASKYTKHAQATKVHTLETRSREHGVFDLAYERTGRRARRHDLSSDLRPPERLKQIQKKLCMLAASDVRTAHGGVPAAWLAAAPPRGLRGERLLAGEHWGRGRWRRRTACTAVHGRGTRQGRRLDARIDLGCHQHSGCLCPPGYPSAVTTCLVQN
jgi:hypothetical protein